MSERKKQPAGAEKKINTFIAWKQFKVLPSVLFFIFLSLPPLLTLGGVLSYEYKFLFLYPMVLAIPVVLLRWHTKANKNNFSVSAFAIYFSTFLLTLVLSLILFRSLDFNWSFSLSFSGLTFSLSNVILQELLFREFAVREMVRRKYPWLITVLVTGLSFGLIHVYLPIGDYLPLFVLLTTMYGLLMSLVYYFKPNIYLMCVHHLFFNVLFLSTGLFW